MSDTPSPTPPASDPGDFLPVSRKDVLDAAKGSWTFRNAWVGRRDRIPDASDPATKLIDRQMVAQGFITPEELAEIHTVGAEYDRKKPLYEQITQQAVKAGAEAVEADKAERARIMAEKKAAAVEREKQRREGVAHRKATDIIFLGRGVSGLMSDRLSDAAKLEALSLPVLHSPADVANALSVTIPQLKWLAYHSEVVKRTHYVRFAVRKKSGGERVLSSPHKRLKAIQRWLLAEVLNKMPLENPAHGFVPTRSIVTNAIPHVGTRFVVNLDLKDFFPSIGFKRVRHAFRRVGYSGAVSTVFALLCTECPRQPVTFNGDRYEVATGPLGLPQGAPTSPALSNLVARKLDKRLAGFAKKVGLNYTRYADDLTFSGPAELSARIGYILAKVRHVAAEEGFTVNEKKTRVMRPSRAMEVTGVVVNAKPSVQREELRRLPAILHRAKTEGLDKQNREERPHFRAWLEGKIAFVSMVNPTAGAKLRAALIAPGSLSFSVPRMTPLAPADATIVEFDVRTDEMLVNMGPQHPSTHGVLRLELTTDGEMVSKVVAHLGYLHRCAEKIGENVTPIQFIPYTDRMDYLAAMNMNLAYSLAIEKLCGMVIPEKAQVLRVLICELNRIASHLVGMGAYGLDLGSFSPFLYAFREREQILDLFEDVCGARLTYSYLTIGGAHDDLPAGWLDRCQRFLEYFKPRIAEYHALLTTNHIFVKRTANVGVLSKEMALAFGCTGPVLRASLDKRNGDPAWDLRKTEPYSGYEGYDFEVPIPPFDAAPHGSVIGDCWHRFYVRMMEVVQSIRICEQAMSKYAKLEAEWEAVQKEFGDEATKDPKGVAAGKLNELARTKYSHRVEPPRTLTPGEVYVETECPRGQMGFHIVSRPNKENVPLRVRARSGCFGNLSVVEKLCRNVLIGDLPSIVGSLDIVMGEIDR